MSEKRVLLTEQVKVPSKGFEPKSQYTEDGWEFIGKLAHPITSNEIENIPASKIDGEIQIGQIASGAISKEKLSSDIQGLLGNFDVETDSTGTSTYYWKGQLNKNTPAIKTGDIEPGAITVDKLSNEIIPETKTSLQGALKTALDFSDIQIDLYGQGVDNKPLSPSSKDFGEGSLKKRIENNETAIIALQRKPATKIDITPIEGDAGHSGTDYYYTINITGGTS